MRNTIYYEEKISVVHDTYKRELTWKDVLAVKDKLIENDVIKGFRWEEIDANQNPFSMAMPDDPPNYQYILYLILERKRLENDEEFVERLRKEEQRKQEQEKQDRETYLRLKAKFE